MASAAKRAIQLNDDLRSNGRRRCTIRFRSFETRLQEEVLACDVRVSSVSGGIAYGGCQTIPAFKARKEAVPVHPGRKMTMFCDGLILTASPPESLALT